MHGIRGLPETYYMVPDVMRVALGVDTILSKRQLSNCIFAELGSAMEFDQTLTWRFGTPYPELYLFTPNRMYIEQNNPMLYLWQNVEPDPLILEKYRARTKYSQGVERDFNLPENFVLFAMQDNFPDEYVNVMRMAAYAEDQKVHVIFKQHPLTATTIATSDYVHFAGKSQNLDHLIRQASCVVSMGSSVCLTAALRGKPVATIAQTPFSELIPQVNKEYRVVDWIGEIEPIDHEDLCRFMTWWAKHLCIDVSQEDYLERIEKRIVDFTAGTTVQELLA